MSIVAMAPPTPFGGKVLIALLLLTLVGLLRRVMYGLPFTGRSITLSIVVAVAAVAVLEVVLPRSYDNLFQNRGLIAGAVGALCAGLLLRSVRQPVCKENPRQPISRTVRLAVLAFICGPLLGLTLATLTILLTYVSPMDRGYTFGVFTSIGTVAGLIGAVIVGVVSAFNSPRTTETDEPQ